MMNIWKSPVSYCALLEGATVFFYCCCCYLFNGISVQFIYLKDAIAYSTHVLWSPRNRTGSCNHRAKASSKHAAEYFMTIDGILSLTIQHLTTLHTELWCVCVCVLRGGSEPLCISNGCRRHMYWLKAKVFCCFDKCMHQTGAYTLQAHHINMLASHISYLFITFFSILFNSNLFIFFPTTLVLPILIFSTFRNLFSQRIPTRVVGGGCTWLTYVHRIGTCVLQYVKS